LAIGDFRFRIGDFRFSDFDWQLMKLQISYFNNFKFQIANCKIDNRQSAIANRMGNRHQQSETRNRKPQLEMADS